MSAHVSLNLLNKLRENDKMRVLPSILSFFVFFFLFIFFFVCFFCFVFLLFFLFCFFATSLMNYIIQEHDC